MAATPKPVRKEIKKIVAGYKKDRSNPKNGHSEQEIKIKNKKDKKVIKSAVKEFPSAKTRMAMKKK